MYHLNFSRRFKKDYKKIRKNSLFQKERFEKILSLLLSEQSLPIQYRNHALTAEYIGYFECHIQPDILLVYEIDQVQKMIYLIRIGSHSELFG